MKQRKQNAILVFFIYPILLVIMFLGAFIWELQSINVGDVWVEYYNADNPYDQLDSVVLEVIDIQNDWVLVIKNNKDTMSLKKHMVKYNAVKIKK